MTEQEFIESLRPLQKEREDLRKRLMDVESRIQRVVAKYEDTAEPK